MPHVDTRVERRGRSHRESLKTRSWEPADPFNGHVRFHEHIRCVRAIPGELGGANIFLEEDVAYRKADIQEMAQAMVPVVPMKPTHDKRSRLQVIAPCFRNGTLLFHGKRQAIHRVGGDGGRD